MKGKKEIKIVLRRINPFGDGIVNEMENLKERWKS